MIVLIVIRCVEEKRMEKNVEKLLRIKEKELIQAFEANNMTCLFVKDKGDVTHYLKRYF